MELLANLHFSDPVGVLVTLLWIVGSFAVPCFAGRKLAGLNPGRSGDERAGNAMAGFVFFLFGVVAFAVAFIMLFIGYAEIPALIGLALWGFGAGVASHS